MKKIYIALAILLGIANFSKAQSCGLATPNLSCTSNPAYPTTCPDDNLPNGTAGQFYSTDITMYFPTTFFEPSAGLDVTINSVDINSVSGMPFGFTWTANPSTVVPSQNEFTALRICGTPFNAGDYTVTISITVFASAFGISQTVNQNIPIALRIDPSTAGNVAFTINNPSGCSPLAASFVTNFPSNGNPGYTYFWDLGNGFTTSQEIIPPVEYVAPGPGDSSYIIQHTVTIDTVGFFLTNVQVTNVSCTDNPGNNPDVYLKIFNSQGQEIFNNSNATIEGTPPYNFPLNIELNSPPYKIQVWDGDGGLLGADDNCADNSEGSTAGVTLLMPTLSGSSTQVGSVGGLIFNYTINHPVIEISGADTITVSPNPAIPTIAAQPGFDYCENTETKLISTQAVQYQWYKADTLLAGATGQFYFTGTPGNYVVQVTNQFGCSAYSDTAEVNQLPAPQTPGIYYTNNLLGTDLTSPPYQLQWFYEGFEFAGQTGQTCSPLFNGKYFVRAENEFGCYSYSDTLNLTKVGLNTLESEGINVNLQPNPASNMVNVMINGKINSDISLSVYNITGQEVIGKILNIGKGQFSNYNESLDISTLPAGIYPVTFRYGNATQTIKLFVY